MFREACVLTEDRNRKRLMGALSLGTWAPAGMPPVNRRGAGTVFCAVLVAFPLLTLGTMLLLLGGCAHPVVCTFGTMLLLPVVCTFGCVCTGNGSEEAEIDVTSFLEVSRKFGLSTVKLSGGRDFHDIRWVRVTPVCSLATLPFRHPSAALNPRASPSLCALSHPAPVHGALVAPCVAPVLESLPFPCCDCAWCWVAGAGTLWPWGSF